MTANNIKEWIRKAEEDLISTEVLLEASKDRIEFLTSTIGFHSQQCIEKSLKGYMIKNQKEFRKTHDITYLLNLVKNIGEKFEFVRDKASLLNEFAVVGRYPGYYNEFTLREAKDAYEVAKKVLLTLKEDLS